MAKTSWGQGERGAAGYDDTGPSEIIPAGRFAVPKTRSRKAKKRTS